MGHQKLKKAAKKIAEADAQVTEAFEPHRKDLPVRMLSKFSELGDQPQLRLISGGAAAAGLLLGNSRLFRAGLRMIVALEAATLVKDAIKDRVDRTRPRTADNHEQAKPKRGSKGGKEESSFPSGHTAGAVAVAQAFAREFPEHRSAALGAAGVIALAQIPRCAHYATDVGAGALIGAASEGLVALPWNAFDRRVGIN